MNLVEQAEAVGFKTASANAQKEYDLARKLLLAYADYPIVTQEEIDKFNSDLKTRTMKRAWPYYSYQTLKLEPIETYATLPPQEVIQAVAAARDTALFSSFSVGYISEESVRLPDPIIFGRIDGCPDYFFIAQWGDDVKFSDIVDGGRSGEARTEGGPSEADPANLGR